MKKQKILESLAIALDKDISDIQSFPEDAPLELIGLDSLAFIRFVVLTEEAFDFTVYDSDLLMSNFETMGSIYTLLAGYIGSYDE